MYSWNDSTSELVFPECEEKVDADDNKPLDVCVNCRPEWRLLECRSCCEYVVVNTGAAVGFDGKKKLQVGKFV